MQRKVKSPPAVHLKVSYEVVTHDRSNFLNANQYYQTLRHKNAKYIMTTLKYIPSEEDWAWKDSPYLDLDNEHLKKRFCGKSLNEVAVYFEQAVLSASEDITYMPKIPFGYYIFAFVDYLMSPERAKDGEASDGASAFLLLIASKLKEFPDFVLPIMEKLMPVAEYVASNQSLFQADVGIYGSFPEQLAEIKALALKARLDSPNKA